MAEYSVIGTSIPCCDAVEKVTGSAMYTADIHPRGMLYGRILGSTVAHGIIKSIDISADEALPGVVTIVTGKDAPDARYGYIEDRHVICKNRVRHVEDPVAAVAAITPEIAEEALRLIKVEYEELPAVLDAVEAYQPDCPVVIHEDLEDYNRRPVPLMTYRFVLDRKNVFIHRKVRHGDIEEGFAKADFIYEGYYSVPRVSHGTIESHVCVVEPRMDGGITFWASEQGGVRFKQFMCDLFGLEPSKVRFISPYIGGFGGKCEVMTGPIAVLLALKAKRPVRVELSREEAFIQGCPCSPATVHIKDGIMKDGTLVAREITEVINGGAYNGHVTVMVSDGAFGAIGTYRIPHYKLDAYGVYTNTAATGPYRSLGSEILSFAIECQMNCMADALCLDKLEIRKKNLLVDGDIDCIGQVTYNNTTMASLEKAAAHIEWGKDERREDGPWIIGKGLAVANKYTHKGTTSVVQLRLHHDGVIEVRHFRVELGQGCNTVHTMIVAEQFGVDPSKVRIVFDDSLLCPFDQGTFCSRGTFMNGNATIKACGDLKKNICARAAMVMNIDADKLDVYGGNIFEKDNPDNAIGVTSLFAYGGYVPEIGELMGTGIFTYPQGTIDAETGQGDPVAYYSYGALSVEAAVNRKTGEIKIFRCGAWFDMGQPLNIKMCEAQSEGTLVMGIGQTCFEEMLFNDQGNTINPNFRDYKIPTMLDVPLNKDVAMGHTGFPHKDGPYGAKGAGEVVLPPFCLP